MALFVKRDVLQLSTGSQVLGTKKHFALNFFKIFNSLLVIIISQF